MLYSASLNYRTTNEGNLQTRLRMELNITCLIEPKCLEMSDNGANNFILNHHVHSNETSRMTAKLWANEVGDISLIESNDGISAT
jgi:hypothetical protein